MKNQSEAKKWIRIVGANFHAVRIAQKKDIETVAKAVKIAPSLLEQIEKGEYDMELGLYVELCRYYDVPLRDMAKENNAGNPPT